MPVVEGLGKTLRPRPGSTHHQDMHYLMTGAIYIEHPRIPSFWNTSCVDGCASKVKHSKAKEIGQTLSLVLRLPAVHKYSVRDRDECRKSKKKVHSHLHWAIGRGAEFLIHGKHTTARARYGCLHIMSDAKRGNEFGNHSYRKFIQELQFRAAIKPKMITGNSRTPHHNHDAQMIQVTYQLTDLSAMIR